MRRIIPLIAVSICLSSVSDGRATHLANSASSCREKSSRIDVLTRLTSYGIGMAPGKSGTWPLATASVCPLHNAPMKYGYARIT
jgi:hypothetical protein